VWCIFAKLVLFINVIGIISLLRWYASWNIYISIRQHYNGVLICQTVVYMWIHAVVDNSCADVSALGNFDVWPVGSRVRCQLYCSMLAFSHLPWPRVRVSLSEDIVVVLGQTLDTGGPCWLLLIQCLSCTNARVIVVGMVPSPVTCTSVRLKLTVFWVLVDSLW